MSPRCRRVERRRPTLLLGVVAELAYALGLSGLCCVLCVLAWFAAS
jgi:hypothetical protein